MKRNENFSAKAEIEKENKNLFSNIYLRPTLDYLQFSWDGGGGGEESSF